MISESVQYFKCSCIYAAGEGNVHTIWQVFCVISSSRTVHQCCNHWGQLCAAILTTVSPPFSGELLEMSPCSILLCPSLILLPRLLAPLSLSLPTLSFLSLLTPLPSPWVLFVLQSFASSVTFVHAYLPLSLVVTLLSSVRADISGAIRQVVRCGFTRLRETRDEKRSVRVARQRLRDVMRDLPICHPQRII